MCHQTVSLVARHLEANGIPTIIIGSALDILQSAAPPRATYLDYPLGHTCGKPFDGTDQLDIVRRSLRQLELITTPGDIVDLGMTRRWTPVPVTRARSATLRRSISLKKTDGSRKRTTPEVSCT